MGSAYLAAELAVLETMTVTEVSPSLRIGTYDAIAQSQPGDTLRRLAINAREAQQEFFASGSDADLAELHRQGDNDASTALLERHSGFIWQQANKRREALEGFPALSVDDLFQAGAMRLLRSADRYTPEKVESDAKFLSYAGQGIKRSMDALIKNEGRNVRLPIHVRDMLGTVDRLNGGRRASNQPALSPAEIAYELGIPEESLDPEDATARRLAWWRLLADHMRSLDGGDPGDDSSLANENMLDRTVTLKSLTSDRAELDPDAEFLLRDLQQAVRDVAMVLDIRERRVLQMQFGIPLVVGEPTTGWSMNERDTAKALRISPTRVRQIRTKAIAKLSRPQNHGNLKAQLNG